MLFATLATAALAALLPVLQPADAKAVGLESRAALHHRAHAHARGLVPPPDNILPARDTAQLERRQRKNATTYTKCVGGGKKIALTFDDGPYTYDTTLRNLLAQYNAKATFFVNGNNWRCGYDNDIITGMRNLFNAGHQFASHSWRHLHLPALTWDQAHDELYQTEVMLNRVLGVQPALFRPPYGETDAETIQVIGTRNQSNILWTYDSGDSLGWSEAQIKAGYQALINNNTNNAIVLNHSVQSLTVNTIMPWLLPKLVAANYTFVTVSQCLGIPAYQWTTAPGTKNSSWVCINRPWP